MANQQESTTSGHRATVHGLGPGLVWLALTAVAYFVATRIGLNFVVQPEGIATIWPSSGVALAALLLVEQRRWPFFLLVVLVTNILGNLAGGNPVAVSLGFGLANLAEPLFGAWLFHRFVGPRITFRRAREVVVLLGVAIIGNGLTALLGAAVPVLAFGAPYFDTWLVWWISDGLGIVLVTPVIVTWTAYPRRLPSWQRVVEGGILLGMIVLFSFYLFRPVAGDEHLFIESYSVFPLLIWAALRFTPRFTSILVLFFSGIAVWNTLLTYEAMGLPGSELKADLLSLQILLGIAGFTASILAALVTERLEMKKKLQESEKRYREIVESPQDLITSVDSQGDYTFVNHVAEKIHGIPARDCLGLSAFQFVHPDDRERTSQWFAECIKQGDILGSIENRQVNQKTGDVFHLLWSCHLHYDEQGVLTGMHGIARDITERKLLEDEREQLIRELRVALDEIKTLRGIIPICAYCRKIRDDQGFWDVVERYIEDRTDAEFSHGICPECFAKQNEEI